MTKPSADEITRSVVEWSCNKRSLLKTKKCNNVRITWDVTIAIYQHDAYKISEHKSDI